MIEQFFVDVKPTQTVVVEEYWLNPIKSDDVVLL